MPAGPVPAGKASQFKDKNVVDAQAPFHQVSTDIFQPRLLVVLDPDIRKKSKSQPNPEKCLVQRLPYGYFLSFFAQEPQVKNQGQY